MSYEVRETEKGNARWQKSQAMSSILDQILVRILDMVT